MISSDVRHAIARAIADEGLGPADPGLRPTGAPGQYASSVAFASGEQPRPLATRVAARLEGAGDIARAEVTGPGFITVTIAPEELAVQAERIARAGLDLPVDDERLVREVILFADKSDISEELIRLDSHLAQFAHTLRKTEPVGRTLDFITQEIYREFNTLGAKANDAEISQLVVTCKAEMEKIREQIQNIE